MDAIKDYPTDKKIHISDEPNDIDGIVCRALFGEHATQVIEQNQLIDEIIGSYEVIILSSASKENCSLAYKSYLKNKCKFYLLKHLDFIEEGFSDDEIFKLLIYNLELFRRKSLRAKSNYITKESPKDIKKSDYDKTFNIELLYKSPLLFTNLYRVIALEKQEPLLLIFSLLDEYDNEIKTSFLDSLVNIAFYAGSETLFCETLIDHFYNIAYSESGNKFYIFLLLNKIYERMNETTIRNIRFSHAPIINYCTSKDLEGEYLYILNKFLETHPPLTVNGTIIYILIYSKIFDNDKYFQEFKAKVKEPSSKNENTYHELLLKVEILLREKEVSGLAPLQLQEGVDQYIKYALDKKTPEQPSLFFDLLLDQSAAKES